MLPEVMIVAGYSVVVALTLLARRVAGGARLNFAWSAGAVVLGVASSVVPWPLMGDWKPMGFPCPTVFGLLLANGRFHDHVGLLSVVAIAGNIAAAVAVLRIVRSRRARNRAEARAG